jgi:Leucine-rich repeat (LRR) protein
MNSKGLILRKISLGLLLIFCSIIVKAEDIAIDGIQYEIIGARFCMVKGCNVNIKKLVIPAKVIYENKEYPVVKINSEAFKNNSELDTVIIENGIKDIGEKCFENCYHLKYVSLPKSIESIPDRMFFNCEYLTNVDIPESLTKIGNYAFYGCKMMKNIDLPSSLTTLGESAFQSCSFLEKIKLPENIIYISDWLFEDCSNLKEVSLSKNSIHIGFGTFANCKSLEHIDLPNSISDIGLWAFQGCESLKEINIPTKETFLGDGTFAKCTSLHKIIIPNNVERITKQGSMWVDGLDGTFQQCTMLDTIFIGSGLKYLGNKAFAECDNIKAIYVYALDPPELSDDSFDGFLKSYIDLYVPEVSFEKYKSAGNWSDFNIKIMDSTTTTIRVPYEVNETERNTSFYNLKGQKIEKVDKGITIIRNSKGVSKKILFK